MSHSTWDYMPPETRGDLVLAWIRRARESQFAHYIQATKFRRSGYWLGVPVIVITTAVGTAYFYSLSAHNESSSGNILIGLVSILAAVLSSLQTFLKFPEKSECHRKFGALYGSIRRRLEQVYAERGDVDISHDILENLNSELSRLAEEAPDVPSKALKIAQENIRKLRDAGSSKVIRQ